MKLKKVLFVGQLPPPLHGQAMVNKMVFEVEWESFEKVVLPMEYSKSIDEVGNAGISKVLHLIYLVLKTWLIWLVERPQVMYYPPASAHKVPVLRDILYLSCTRFLFSRTVYHFHAGGLGQYLDSVGLFGKLAKLAYGKPDIAIELYKENDSPGQYLGAKCIRVVANGLKVNKLEEERGGEQLFTLLFMGSLCEDKGVLDAIKTLKLLKDRNVSVQMKFAGAWASSEFRELAETLVVDFGVGAEVEWLGVVTGEQKWTLLNSVDVFFFPSFYHSEKFPLVLIEALGCGLPVVSTKWRGIPQMLEGSGAGFLYEIHQLESFADAIEELAGEPEKQEKMSLNARSHYEAYYTEEQFLEGMQRVFNSLNL